MPGIQFIRFLEKTDIFLKFLLTSTSYRHAVLQSLPIWLAVVVGQDRRLLTRILERVATKLNCKIRII